ncbi:MAG: hypothetical protein KC621_24925 [Myxococcales bacterium]|nr:hypothetical protein [Myxococcales bacterium]
MMSGCSDVTSATEDNDQEVITTTELTFSPTTGDDQVFSWADPENDGDPIIDQLTWTPPRSTRWASGSSTSSRIRWRT